MNTPTALIAEDEPLLAQTLANELRVFVSATERGQLDCFASRASGDSPPAAEVPTPPDVALY